MKILFVVPNVPSQIRSRPYNLIKRLSKNHEIELVCLVADAYEEKFLDHLSRYCRTVTPFRLSKPRAYLNCAAAMASTKPLRVAYFFHRDMQRYIAESVRENRFDIVHVEHAKARQLVDNLPDIREIVAYDVVDSLSLFLERQIRTTSSVFRRLFIATELFKMRLYERRHPRDFPLTVITSPVDARRIQTLTHGQVQPVVLPNGVDLDVFQYDCGHRDPNLIVFCAKLDYFPNAQAASYFAAQIFPRLREWRPEARLIIVGSNPPSYVRRLGAQDGIEVTGYVPDIRPYLVKASVAIAPLLTKAGTQYKILEAMAVGTPVVATPLACEGLAIEPEVHLLAADGADDFARQVARLLDQPDLARLLARNGRTYVERHHGWTAIAVQLESLYAELGGRHGGSEPDLARS